METPIIPESLFTEYTELQKQFVLELSRDIIVGLPGELEEDCPNCYYDGVSGSSGAQFTYFEGTVTLFSGTAYEVSYEALPFKQVCPVCHGIGAIKIPNESIIPAHIYWIESEDSFKITPAGEQGQAEVQLKTNSIYYSTIVQAIYFIVDGVKVLLSMTPTIRGMGSADGIVEWRCKTSEIGKDTYR